MKNILDEKYGLSVAIELRRQLEEQGYPIRSVLLFGSLAKGGGHKWSDIDLAVVTDPFLASKYDEGDLFSRVASAIDVRTEVICLHPEDFQNKYFTLAREVERYGVRVG